jgi:hypothetical protein
MAGVAALPAWVGREGDEAMQGVGEVPQPGPGRGDVPVDEGPLRVVDDKVPGGQVVVDNEVDAVGGDQGLPSCIWRWREVGDGVVEVADELGNVGKLPVGFEQVEVVGLGDGAGDEAEDLPPLLVKPERPGCATEADRVQVGKQRMDSRCPGTRRARTVSPTRTTPLLMFPPDSGISALLISHSLAGGRVASRTVASVELATGSG